MDFHNLSLALYEKWERAQDAIDASGLLERFLDKIQAGFTFTVQLVDED